MNRGEADPGSTTVGRWGSIDLAPLTLRGFLHLFIFLVKTTPFYFKNNSSKVMQAKNKSSS